MPSSDRQRASNHQKSNIHGETQHAILEPNLFPRRLINDRSNIRSSRHKTVLTSHRSDKTVEKQTTDTATWHYNTASFALTTTATIDDQFDVVQVEPSRLDAKYA